MCSASLNIKPGSARIAIEGLRGRMRLECTGVLIDRDGLDMLAVGG